MRPTSALTRKRAAGFSMVELMVAIVISLVGSIVVFQVYAVFEGQKRTTTSGGDAQSNAALALFAIEREARMAGYGMNNVDFLGCDVKGWDKQLEDDGDAATDPLLAFHFAPVEIIQGAGAAPPLTGAPDRIAIMYGNSDTLISSVQLTQNLADAAENFRVNNRYGFRTGDIVVAAEAGKNCTLAQVSDLPLIAGQTDIIVRQSGTYPDPNNPASNLPIRYNKAGGLAAPDNVLYTTNGKLFSIGGRPANNVYMLSNGQLMQQQRLFGDATAASASGTPIYDGFVQLQAQYGKDTNDDGIVEVFNDTTPATTADWKQVLAIRIAVVARSSQYERDRVYCADNSNPCSENPPPVNRPAYLVWPSWAGGTFTMSNVDGTADSSPGDTNDWRHYRYKVFQTTVPLRNMLWKPGT